MFGVRGASVVGATAADAPPTSEKVNPAAPNTGTVFVTRFRFEACFALGMLRSPTLLKLFRVQPTNSTLCKCSVQDAPAAEAHRVPAIHVHERRVHERRRRRFSNHNIHNRCRSRQRQRVQVRNHRLIKAGLITRQSNNS
jgi:hypothetical protein